MHCSLELKCISHIFLLSRIDGKPEDVLNPKKKQLEKITPVSISFMEYGSAFFCLVGIPYSNCLSHICLTKNLRTAQPYVWISDLKIQDTLGHAI